MLGAFFLFLLLAVGAVGQDVQDSGVHSGQTPESMVGGDHLLRLFDSQQLEDGRLVDDEILIFRDGLTVLKRTLGRQSRVFRSDPAAPEIQALKDTLVAEAVDTQEGNCNLVEAPRVLSGPLGLRSRSTWLSWFGVAGRRARHFALGYEGSASEFTRECSAEVQKIVEQAFEFAQGVLAGPTTTQGPDEHYPRSLLFSVRNGLQSDPVCTPYRFEESALIFRDGLLLHHFLDSDGSFNYTRSQVPRGMRQELSRVLEEERIASIDEHCRTWFFLPFPVDGACLGYTWQSKAIWHGRGGRQGVIGGDDQTELRCGAPEARVRGELVRYLAAAVTDGKAASVTGVFEAP